MALVAAVVVAMLPAPAKPTRAQRRRRLRRNGRKVPEDSVSALLVACGRRRRCSRPPDLCRQRVVEDSEEGTGFDGGGEPGYPPGSPASSRKP
jgi:hypothetical protein